MEFGVIASSNSSSNFILDEMSGAGFAYSLRKLRSGYTGSAIQVKRSSDNTTQDIGFDSNGDLDTTALSNFVGAGTGYVSIWYDQSGNGRNIQNTGTNSTKPRIVVSGTTQVSGPNSRPAIKFTSSSNQRLNSASSYATVGTSISSTGETFAVVVQEQNADDHTGCTVGHGTDSGVNRYGLFLGLSGTYDADLGNYNTRRVTVAEPAGVGGEHANIIVYDDGVSEQKIIRNGTTLVTGSNTAEPVSVNRRMYIGCWGQVTLFFDGYIQEVIIWPSNQVSKLTSVQNSIDVYYQ